MNVIVNGRFLERRITGVERYGREILCRLGNRPAQRGDRALRVIRSKGWAGGVRGHLWEQVTLAGQLGHDDVLWSPANTGPLNVENQVLTLHDISPLEHPKWFQPAFALWYRFFVPPLVRRVRRVVTSSEYTREKLLKRFGLHGERVKVVPGGVDARVFHPGAISRLDLPSRYALFVGSLQPRKNLPRLLDAWERIKDTVPDAWLLVAGTGGSVFRPVSLAVHERVKFLGAVPDSELPGLYASATVFILPSLDEGFGLTLLEAMACGTMVIASNAGALPEVVADNGLIIDPLDGAEIADMLQLGLQDASLCTTLREKGIMRAQCFSWDTSAERLWQVFEGCL
jgi:glycosyltransferase involved in cell wall biosynthesis